MSEYFFQSPFPNLHSACPTTVLNENKKCLTPKYQKKKQKKHPSQSCEGPGFSSLRVLAKIGFQFWSEIGTDFTLYRWNLGDDFISLALFTLTCRSSASQVADLGMYRLILGRGERFHRSLGSLVHICMYAQLWEGEFGRGGSVIFRFYALFPLYFSSFF